MAATWAAVNPVLNAGEPGVEVDTNKFKIGNGFTPWSGLPYFVDEPGVNTLIQAAVLNGVPGADGKSAYEVAVVNGFVGTQSQWLASLVGPAGSPGATGAAGATGPMGPTGPAGPSGGAVFPLSEWNDAHSASMHPDAIDGVSTIGNMFFARMLVPAGKAITKVTTFLSSAATAPTATDAYVLYSDSGVKIGETSGDITLFGAGPAGPRWRNLITPVAAQGSDRWVWGSVYAAAPGGMLIGYKANGGVISGATTNRRSFYMSPGSLPASINPVTDGSTSFTYIPFYMLG